MMHTGPMSWVGLLGIAFMAAVPCQAKSATPVNVVSTEPALDASGDLEILARSGNLPRQRQYVWDVLVDLTRRQSNGQPLFESWYGENQVFSSVELHNIRRGIRGFRASRGNAAFLGQSDVTKSADSAVLTYTLYNYSAYKHIRDNRLYLISQLDSLRTAGEVDQTFGEDRSVPTFPSDAVVIKTAWWPIAQNGLTAMPVWDPERNPPRPSGNPYISWQRVIAVDATGPSNPQASANVRTNLAGRSIDEAHRVGLGAFYYVVVDAPMAKQMRRDHSAQKAALIALGRPIRAGDYLALVAVNMATREINNWIWAAFWWHDYAERGVLAADRPNQLIGAFRNYLLQVAFDSDKPAAIDGGPHICFNPWLEGRFPNGGQGSGTKSNCIACHRRASYPVVSFLPVTRGIADPRSDSAFAPARLRTSFLWAIGMHARPDSRQIQ
jgi:hypothetical protein